MPLFEYHCRDCGRAFEAFVTGDRKAACPGCRGENLGKLLSRPGMVGASAEPSSRSAESSFGGCGAGGASCACRANPAH